MFLFILCALLFCFYDVNHVCVWCLRRSEKGAFCCPRTGIMDSLGSPFRCGELNVGRAHRQEVLLPTEPFLHTHKPNIFKVKTTF